MAASKFFLVFASVLLAYLPIVASESAYIYYQDAQCVSGGDIYGKLIFAYDTSRMKGKGFKMSKYNGKCKYFKNGRHDLHYDTNASKGSFMLNGYCIKCNGMIGCTSTKNSCEGFSTLYPNTPYTQSENGAVSEEEYYENLEEQAEVLEESVYEELMQMSAETSRQGILYSLLGVGAAMLSIGSIFVAAKAIRRMQKNKASIKLVEGEVSSDYEGGIIA